jgi:bacterial/archaeal transporter family-2 protein
VCGQLLSALLIDWKGLFGTEKLTIHAGRIGGCLLTFVGSVMVFAADDGGGDPSSTDTSIHGHRILMMMVSVCCAFINGLFLPTQAAVNNMLKREKKLSTPETVGVSFLVAAVSLTVVAALTYIYFPAAFDTTESDNWWMWFGGIVGVMYVQAGTQFSPIIGYSSFFIAIITGQLTLSLLSDVFGLLGPVVPSATNALSLSGVACAVCGALIVSVYKAKETNRRLNEPTAAAIMTMDEVNDGNKMTILQDSFGGIQQEYFEEIEMGSSIFNPLAYHDPNSGIADVEHHTDDHLDHFDGHIDSSDHVAGDGSNVVCIPVGGNIESAVSVIDNTFFGTIVGAVKAIRTDSSGSRSGRVCLDSYLHDDVDGGRDRNMSSSTATSQDRLLGTARRSDDPLHFEVNGNSGDVIVY